MENKKKAKKAEISIGTDPEFALVDRISRKVINADQYEFFRSKDSTARIGSDGAGTPVEIRPLPTKITEIGVIIDDIRDIFIRIAKWCSKRNYTICGGAMVGKGNIYDRSIVPIGSHIHFGGEDFLAVKKEPRLVSYSEIQDEARSPVHNSIRNRVRQDSVKDNITILTRCLDVYLIPIINFFISSKEIEARTRRGYGYLGVWRNQKWGIEYRTPYCFLLSPLLTAGIYSLASLIAYNYKKISPDKNLYRETIYYYDLLSDANKSRKIQKSIYKKIKPKLLKMMSYNSPNPKFNSKIISMFNLIEQNKTCKNRDVLTNYNLDDIKTPPFTIYYGRGQSMKSLRRMIEGGIRNKTDGEIYLYSLPYSPSGIGMPDGKKAIVLSEGLPKIHNDNIGTIYEKKIHGGLKYSIGFSEGATRHLLRNATNVIFLVKYLNGLKLRY